MTDRKRFTRNLAVKTTMLVLLGVASIWFTRYLVKELGVALYGTVMLALVLKRYAEIFAKSLNSATSRFLTIDLTQGAVAQANKTFNSGLYATSVLMAVLLLPMMALAYGAPAFFQIVPGTEWATRGVFGSAFLALIITAMAGPLGAALFARNRLDLQAMQNAASAAIYMIIPVVLITLTDWNLMAVAVSMVFSSTIGAVIGLCFWHKVTPELSVCRRDIDRTRLWLMLRMGGYVFVGQTGALLFLKVDLVVANLALGAAAAGTYGAILQIPMMIRVFADDFSQLVAPSIMTFHATDRHDVMVKVLGRAVKWVGLIIALPVGLLCAAAEPMLVLWLGPEFAAASDVFVVMLAPLVVNLAVAPLFSVGRALNRVRVPAYVTLILGVVNLLLAIVLASPQMGELGLLGIALAGAIVLTGKNLLFTPIYTAWLLKVPSRTFFHKMLWPMAALAATWALGAAALRLVPDISLGSLVLALATAGCAASAGVWLVALSKEERSWMLAALKGK